MRFMEFGTENKEVLLLLHGGGLSWWNYRDAARHLENKFHVVLPILDGHTGSDRAFTSIEDNAEEIIAFVDSHFGGSVLMMGGLSLGGQVLLEILSRRKDICRFAFIESAPVIPSRLTHAMIAPVFGSCYGLIRRKWFSRLQFQYLRIRNSLFDDYYRDTCGITKENMIAFLRANALYTIKDTLRETSARVHIFLGGREIPSMAVSAKKIQEVLPGSRLHRLPGLHHGEFSINHSAEYASLLKQIVRESNQ